MSQSNARLIQAGRSDKYGQVYVERVGTTGFDDPTEPLAILRAQDEHALAVMKGYLARFQEDLRVPRDQLASVQAQVANFIAWREPNRAKVRVPGTRQRVGSSCSDDCARVH